MSSSPDDGVEPLYYGPTANVEKRGERFYVEDDAGDEHGHVFDPKSQLRFYADEIRLASYVQLAWDDDSKQVPLLFGYRLDGVATLANGTLSILGNDDMETRSIPFSFTSDPEIEGELGAFKPYDPQKQARAGEVEIYISDEPVPRWWRLSGCLERSVFEKLAVLHRQERLESWEFHVSAAMWIGEDYEGRQLLWEPMRRFLAPPEIEDDGSYEPYGPPTTGTISWMQWGEKTLPLKPHTVSHVRKSKRPQD